jgi:predicted metal-dependent hydrolase
MNDPILSGINFFNEGLYYEAHESWEDGWRACRGDERGYLKGLVQIAVGLHHLTRGNTAGGVRVLERGLSNLRPYPARCLGIDTASLIHDVRMVVNCPEPRPNVRIHAVGPSNTDTRGG